MQADFRNDGAAYFRGKLGHICGQERVAEVEGVEIQQVALACDPEDNFRQILAGRQQYKGVGDKLNIARAELVERLDVGDNLCGIYVLAKIAVTK